MQAVQSSTWKFDLSNDRTRMRAMSVEAPIHGSMVQRAYTPAWLRDMVAKFCYTTSKRVNEKSMRLECERSIAIAHMEDIQIDSRAPSRYKCLPSIIRVLGQCTSIPTFRFPKLNTPSLEFAKKLDDLHFRHHHLHWCLHSRAIGRCTGNIYERRIR